MRRGVTKMAANFGLTEKRRRYLVDRCCFLFVFPFLSLSTES